MDPQGGSRSHLLAEVDRDAERAPLGALVQEAYQPPAWQVGGFVVISPRLVTSERGGEPSNSPKVQGI